MVKSFGVSFETALYDMSYANVVMYMRTLPDYSADTKKKGEKRQEQINADDPANQNKIEKLLFGNG